MADDMNDGNGTGVVRQLPLDRSTLRQTNPVTSGHTAIVYLNKRGAYEVGAGRLTMGEIWWNTPRRVYEVRVAPREDTFTVELPSSEEAFGFAADVRLTWQVSDPIAAVRAELDDPTTIVRQFVEEQLRESTRQFDVESSAAAERRINLDFGTRSLRVSDAVTVTRCSVVLTLDESTRQHIQSRTHTQREIESLAQTQQTEKFAHDLRKLQDQNSQELERLKEAHELELKRQRVDFYAEALATGSHRVLALRLSGHDEDVNDVIAMMMKQKSLEFDSAREVLNSLLEANLLNRKDVAGIMANASNRMVDHLSGGDQLGIGQAGDRANPAPPKPVIAERADDDEDDDEDD